MCQRLKLPKQLARHRVKIALTAHVELVYAPLLNELQQNRPQKRPDLCRRVPMPEKSANHSNPAFKPRFPLTTAGLAMIIPIQ